MVEKLEQIQLLDQNPRRSGAKTKFQLLGVWNNNLFELAGQFPRSFLSKGSRHMRLTQWAFSSTELPLPRHNKPTKKRGTYSRNLGMLCLERIRATCEYDGLWQ